MRSEAGEFPCELSGPCRDLRPTWAGARSSGWRSSSGIIASKGAAGTLRR